MPAASLFRSVASAKAGLAGRALAVTVGNFDGMHLGHRALFDEVRKIPIAQARVLLTFHPHPRFFFKRFRGEPLTSEERLLTPIRRKFQLALELGFDAVISVRFDSALAALPPTAFIEQNIFALGDVRGIVVGEDWCFGRNRSGNAELLREVAAGRGVELRVVCDQSCDGARISSSRIRALLKAGEISEANLLLGSPFALYGKVFRGDQRGRQLGFPTANIAPKNALTPRVGVYVTTTEVFGRIWPSITNVGVRPTFQGEELRVETHILDGFDEELYTKRINVYFHDRIREELKFASVSELKSQIERDIRARAAFSV